MASVKSAQYKEFEIEGLRKGLSGRRLRAYIKGRAWGRGKKGRYSPSSPRFGMSKKSKAVPKRAIMGKSAAYKILKIDSKIEPLLKDIEEKIHADLEEEQQKLIRSKRIYNLIPQIEEEIKTISLYNTRVIELNDELQKEEEAGLSVSRSLITKALGNSRAQKIAKEINRIEARVIQMINHITEELDFIEKTVHALRTYDVAEKVDHKKVKKWVEEIRDEVKFARTLAFVEEAA